MDLTKTKTATILSGVLAIILGLLLISMPGLVIGTVILLFSLYLILFGGIKVFDSIRAKQGSEYRLPWLIGGSLAIIAGLGLIMYPGVSVVFLAYLVSFYAIAIGIIELTAGLRGNNSTGMKILAVIAGLLSIIFGIYLFIYPEIGTALLIMILGWYQIFYGILLVIMGFMKKPQVA